MSTNDSFEQMMNMWSEGQTAFFKAQKEAVENFESVLSGVKPEEETTDPYAAWHQFIQAWAPNWDTSAMKGESANDVFTNSRDAFLNLLDPSNWSPLAPEQLRKILEGIVQGPQFADLATPQVDAAEVWRETLDYQQSLGEMAQVLQETWTRTLKKYSEEYSVEDLNSGDVTGALEAWLKIANAELLKTQGSKEFLAAQRSLLRSSVEIKARMKEVAEVWSESYQIPTRTEVDDLTKVVHELRREVRILKREVAALKGK
jgi:hypothetical protein